MLDTDHVTAADLRAPEDKALLTRWLTERLQETEKALAAIGTRPICSPRREFRWARQRANMYMKWTSRKPMAEQTKRKLKRSIIAQLRLYGSPGVILRRKARDSDITG